jgi:hypothetical protein
MKLEGKWQLIGCHVLDASQEFEYDEVYINFKSLNFLGVRNGFLKTSLKTERFMNSSMQTFKWEFVRFTNQLKIKYIASKEAEVFKVQEINRTYLELRNNKQILKFIKKE